MAESTIITSVGSANCRNVAGASFTPSAPAVMPSVPKPPKRLLFPPPTTSNCVSPIAPPTSELCPSTAAPSPSPVPHVFGPL